jgi:hypothetical protein
MPLYIAILSLVDLNEGCQQAGAGGEECFIDEIWQVSVFSFQFGNHY